MIPDKEEEPRRDWRVICPILPDVEHDCRDHKGLSFHLGREREPEPAKEVRSEDEQRRIFRDLQELAAAYPAAYCVSSTLLDLKPQVWEGNRDGEWALVDLGTFEEDDKTFTRWTAKKKKDEKAKQSASKPNET